MKKLSLSVVSLLVLGTSLYATTLSKKVQNNSLIVYNANMGLVHEERTLKMHSGDEKIIYKDVASSIVTDSVNVTLPKEVALYSQQYRYDKITQSKLLTSNIGKKVEVRVLKDRENFKVISATLIAVDATQAIIKRADNKILSVNKNDIIFSSIPKDLITKPSLVWNVKTESNINSKLELDYLINNISWSANYILNLSKEYATLTGWIKVENNSGKRFEDVELKVLAGDLNRATHQKVGYLYNSKKMTMDAPMQKGISHDGYHIYPVGFHVTLADREKTQIKFISKQHIKVQREYSAKLSNPLYLNAESQSSVAQYVKINSLDIALPKGTIRSYSKLANQTILLGVSHLSHTPKNTPIKLKLGNNFDLKVTQTLLSRDNSKVRVSSKVKYRVKNSSDEDKTIELFVPFNRNKSSKIESSQEYKFKKGNLATFKLQLKANSSKEFVAEFSTNR